MRLEELAINRGNPVRVKPFPKWPIFTEKDKEDLVAVLDDGRLTAITGPKVKEFEDKYASVFESKYALATCNGVTAIHLALVALNVGPGDEVIVPAHTFIGTAIPVLMQNAIPVFVDINPETFNINPAKIEEAITSRTKVIMPVHLNGLPAEMDEIKKIANKHNVKVVEDACQAHGAKYKNKLVGTIGDIACFSFFEDKVLTTGEGGILLTNNEEYFEIARSARSYGEAVSKDIAERKYETMGLGFNYRMGSLNAALGINQLDRMEEMTEKRRKNAANLREKLSTVSGIIPPKDLNYVKHVYYKFVCKIDPNIIKTDLLTFINSVKAEGVPITPRYPLPLPLQKIFKEKSGYGKTHCPYDCDKYGLEPAFTHGHWLEAERVGKEAFVLLVHPTINEEDLDDVVAAVSKVAKAYSVE